MFWCSEKLYRKSSLWKEPRTVATFAGKPPDLEICVCSISHILHALNGVSLYVALEAVHMPPLKSTLLIGMGILLMHHNIFTHKIVLLLNDDAHFNY